ncbi:MAG TPA: rod shape-determining protein [Bacillota bacterium]|nr:rod shape-determining protein [Bacillota bacterium]
MAWSYADIGIDLGTERVRVVVRGRGVVIDEPSAVAVHRQTGLFVAAGRQAEELLTDDPYKLVRLRPLSNGAVSRYDCALMLLRSVLSRTAGGRSLARPKVAMSVPARPSQVEKRTWLQVAIESGARATALVEAPMAAAIGAGADVLEPGGVMVVDIGAQVTDIGVLSTGGIVVSDRLRIGGASMDRAIQAHARNVHGLVLGQRSAEKVKIELGAEGWTGREASAVAHGRNLADGLPREETLNAREVSSALEHAVNQIIESARCVFGCTPPELAADIAAGGIILTGGGSRLAGLSGFMSERMGVAFRVALDPDTCVIRGIGELLHGMDPRVTCAWKGV